MSPKLKERKLPQGWEWATLGEICEINPRKPKDFVRSDNALTTFVPMKAVNAIKGEANIQRTEPYGKLKKGYTYFINGDVLFAKITPCMQNGKHFIAKDLLDEIGFASTEFHVLRPNALLFAEWVHFYLRQPSLLKRATYHFTGAVGQQRVPISFLKELEIPMPPLSEQKRIVADLNKKMAAVEKARAATLERVEAIRALPAAFLREIFSFDDGKLPQGWRWAQLGDVCKIMVGKTPPRENKDSFGGRHQWAKISDMNNPIIVSTDETLSDKGAQICSGRMIEKGTLLYSFKLSIGKTAFTGTDMFTNEAIAGLIPKDALILSKAFLRYALIFGDYGSFADVAAKGKTLNKTKLAQLDIPLPPLSEQKQIVADLNKKMAAIEKARNATEEESEATHVLPAAFLREAFSGAL